MDAQGQGEESGAQKAAMEVGDGSETGDARAFRHSVAVIAVAVMVAFIAIIGVALLYERSGQAPRVGDGLDVEADASVGVVHLVATGS